VGHVADAQYLPCSPVAGTPNPAPGIEKSKTTKEDLVAGLKDAFAYCDKAYASLTDANAAELVKFFGGERTKLNVLSFSFMLNYEHYGNMVTYMRMKNIVPLTSEPRTPRRSSSSAFLQKEPAAPHEGGAADSALRYAQN